MSGRKGESGIGVGGGVFRTDAKAFASDITDEQAGLKYNRETEKDIKQFFKYSLQKDGIDADPNTGEPIVKQSVAERAERLAEKIAERTIERDVDAARQYRELKKELESPIYVSKSERNKITDFEIDYNKKSGPRNIRITSNPDKVSLDTKYQELTRRFPQHFDATRQTTTEAQLSQINRVMDTLKSTKETNARKKYGDSIVRDIVDSLYAYSYTINADVKDYRKSRKK